MSLPTWSPRILLAAVAGYIFTYLTIPLIRRFALATGCVAHPAEDRWGRRIVPRLGGLSIAAGLLGATLWSLPHDHRLLGLLLAGLWMGGVGLVDDFRNLHPISKLIAQIVAGCLVVLCGLQVDLEPFWLAVPLTIAWLVLVMNAFNLMDNMDGLSAGIGAIAALFSTWYALQADQVWTALIFASILGTTLGFLRYNLPPAKIFMGDTGSQVLGLSLGTLTMTATWHQPVRLLGILSLPTLLLAVPIFDTLFVTVQRLLHHRHPFQGGTDHLSHRLGILGLTSRQVVFTLYGLTAAFGALSLVIVNQEPLSVLAVWLLAIGFLLMLGAHLAKVRVYTEVEPPPAEAKVTWIETMLMHKRRLVEASIDFVLICASYVMAHALRFEANITPDLENLILRSLPWVIVVKICCFSACGLYRGIWRYISLTDLVNIIRAVLFGSVLSALVVLYLWRFEGYSRAVFIIDGTLLFLMVSGARLIEPLLNEWVGQSGERGTQVLIVGAGDTGELLLQQLKLQPQTRHRVMGFLDDDPSIQGRAIHGIPILGTRRDLGRIVKAYGIRLIFIAMEHPPGDLIRQVQGYCEENGLEWRVVRSLAAHEAPLPAE